MTITITKRLDDTWAEPGQLDLLSDSEIVDLLQEDITEVLAGARWGIWRDDEDET